MCKHWKQVPSHVWHSKVTDALSRRTNAIYGIIISKLESDLEERIKNASINDTEYVKTTERSLKNEGNVDGIGFSIGKMEY
jgi:hypothetical protein